LSLGADVYASMALDRKHELLYYTRKSRGFIEEVNKSGYTRRRLFIGNNSHPHAIVSRLEQQVNKIVITFCPCYSRCNTRYVQSYYL